MANRGYVRVLIRKQELIFRIWPVVAALFLLPGCASQRIVEWPGIEGRVLEEGTGKPIEDAVVVALWKGTAPFTTTVCFHVESTTTDSDGRYVIPVWRNEGDWNNLADQYVAIYAYKAGYSPIGSSGKFANVYTEREFNKTQSEWIAGPGRVDKAMGKFLGTKKERLEYLLQLSGRCFTEENKQLISLIKAISREAKEIAVTKKDNEVVDSLRYSLDVLEVGWDEANKRRVKGDYHE